MDMQLTCLQNCNIAVSMTQLWVTSTSKLHKNSWYNGWMSLFRSRIATTKSTCTLLVIINVSFDSVSSGQNKGQNALWKLSQTDETSINLVKKNYGKTKTVTFKPLSCLQIIMHLHLGKIPPIKGQHYQTKLCVDLDPSYLSSLI